jgi:hypothetical protein
MPQPKRWVHKVKTVSTFPPGGLFTKDARTIARVMASKKVSPKGLSSGIRMIQFFINRGGRGLSAARKRELEKAKRILQERMQKARQATSYRGDPMPKKKTIQRAPRAKREGKAPSTQAGEFVRETIESIREGKHGARSTKQAIAIGLSKARRAGVDLPPPKKGTTSAKTRESAKRAYEAGQKEGAAHKPSAKRSRAVTQALKREPKSTASSTALSRQAKTQARKRTAAERTAIAKKAARTRMETQTAEERSRSARKAARTRARKK